MTTTDRAFIAAIQQASAGLGATTSPAAGIAAPHFERRSPAATTKSTTKAPLSEHLARRRAAPQASASMSTNASTNTTTKVKSRSKDPLRPGVEVDSLRWPAAAVQLEKLARPQLLKLLSHATRDGETAETPVIAFVSAQRSVGATTTLLATARLLAEVGGKVAILDLSSSEGAAIQLGIRRVAHLDGRLDASAIDDLLVASRDGSTSVLAATGERLAEVALDRLVATHDLVLIDGGDARAPGALLGTESMITASVLLVDSAKGDQTTRREASQRLAEAGIAISGIVETFAEAA